MSGMNNLRSALCIGLVALSVLVTPLGWLLLGLWLLGLL
jgi:hypothetical protein